MSRTVNERYTVAFNFVVCFFIHFRSRHPPISSPGWIYWALYLMKFELCSAKSPDPEGGESRARSQYEMMWPKSADLEKKS